MVKSSSVLSASQRHDEQLNPDTDDNDSDSASQATAASRQLPMHRRLVRKRKHNVMGNDPYDYEKKYPEDEPYKAMGSMARIWKVFLDECTKFHAEMVDDWQDALDVLLVFAGLFSAVVTTFISQTSQKLQPDYTQITASEISEVAELVRAAMTGGPEDVKAIPRAAETVATFEPDHTAIWVNGLWFTSLALSLTTALLAVLTKQWIHQYMSIPSGTPRDRSRTRHYRFLNLEKWHVPLIIGLLPVLLHLSLGIFFAGLLVFLHTINLTTSSVTTGIVILGFAAYFGTNFLPLFKPDCPYKTPLTLYLYGISMGIWNYFKRFTEGRLNVDVEGPRDTTPDGPTSLRDVEKEQVQQKVEFIDARCVSWLYNMTSNFSVQSIAIQAFSDLPLRSTKIFEDSVVATAQTIQDMLLAPENVVPDRHSVRVRLARAWYKFNTEEDPPRSAQDDLEPLSIAVLTDVKHQKEAANFLHDQISNPTVELDVLSWTVIIRNALRSGTDWLDVHNPYSKVWATLVELPLSKHICVSYNACKIGALMTMSVNVRRTMQGNRVYCTLSILDLPGVDEVVDFLAAVANFLLPSFSDILWTIAYPSSAHSTGYHDLPPQLRLHLDLFQTSYVRRGFDIGLTFGIVMKVLIQHFKSYVGIVDFIGADVTRAHPTLSLASFRAFCVVVGSHEFTSGSFTFSEQCDVLHILFRLLVSNDTSRIAFTAWLSLSMAKRIIDVVFADPQVIPSPLITDILEYTASSKSQLLVYEVYTALRRREWIEKLWPFISLKDPYNRAYPFMCSAFVDGLDVLKNRDLYEYQHTVDYIIKPSNLFDLAVAILMADVDKRQRIRQLASIAGQDAWSSHYDRLLRFCCDRLDVLTTSSESDIQHAFNYHANFMQGRHPYNFKVTLSYGKFADLADLVASTAYPSTNTSEGCFKRLPGWRTVVSGWIERETASSESDDDHTNNRKESV